MMRAALYLACLNGLLSNPALLNLQHGSEAELARRARRAAEAAEAEIVDMEEDEAIGGPFRLREPRLLEAFPPLGLRDPAGDELDRHALDRDPRGAEMDADGHDEELPPGVDPKADPVAYVRLVEAQRQRGRKPKASARGELPDRSEASAAGQAQTS
jgi:hypothetical protein